MKKIFENASKRKVGKVEDPTFAKKLSRLFIMRED